LWLSALNRQVAWDLWGRPLLLLLLLLEAHLLLLLLLLLEGAKVPCTAPVTPAQRLTADPVTPLTTLLH
jgi:hypothetical protein